MPEAPAQVSSPTLQRQFNFSLHPLQWNSPDLSFRLPGFDYNFVPLILV